MDGDGGGEGGVDSAGEAEDDGGEAAFADVIAQAEDQGFKDGFDAAGGSVQGSGGIGEVGDEEVFFEIFGLGDDFAGGVEDDAVAVEDELIVAADLVDVDQGVGKLSGL